MRPTIKSRHRDEYQEAFNMLLNPVLGNPAGHEPEGADAGTQRA
jgi:hypothetical protein